MVLIHKSLAHPSQRRRAIRYLAAAVSGMTAMIYFLIGFEVLPVVDVSDGPSLLYFGIPAGLAFMLGAFLLLAYDRRALWMLGTAFQVFVILMYINVAPERTPPYEFWGILLRVAQLIILAALIYLVIRPPLEQATTKNIHAVRKAL
jgi:hypothetical protein